LERQSYVQTDAVLFAGLVGDKPGS
jgi:hypothetical protein